MSDQNTTKTPKFDPETGEELTSDEEMARLIPVFMAGFAAGIRSILVGKMLSSGIPLQQALETAETEIDNILRSTIDDEDAFHNICLTIDGVWLEKRAPEGASLEDRTIVSMVKLKKPSDG